MTDRVHEQMQWHIRPVSEECATLFYCVAESVEVNAELFTAVFTQIEVVLQCCSSVGEENGCIDRVGALEFLPQVALHPGKVVLEDAGIVIAGRKVADRITQMFG